MNIDSSFEELCYKEERRNGTVAGGESGFEKVTFLFKGGRVRRTCLCIDGNDPVVREENDAREREGRIGGSI